MSRRKRLWIPLLLFIVSLACAVPIPTTEPLTIIDPPAEEFHTLGPEGAQEATVRLRMLSDRLSVRPDNGAALLNAWFHYNVAEWEPDIDQTTRGEVTQVSIKQGLGSQIQLGKLDERYINEWNIGLARNIRMDVDIDLGSGIAQLDLGGLALKACSLTTGGADAVLNFAEHNPEPLGRLRLTTGTGKFVASGLGNANFDHLSVLGGAGTIDLDFSGAWRRSAVADVRAGAGKMFLRVPSSIGVRVTLSSPLSSVDTLGFTQRSDKEYVNAAYGQAPLTLTINVTTGVGAISLISQ
jgi:hypothetical protein